MFWALAKGKIPLEGFQIEHVIEDIETLNRRAFQAELEVTALSCHAFGLLTERYQLIPYGASVGENYGPVLVAPHPNPLPRGEREKETEISFSPEQRERAESKSPSPPEGERAGVRGRIRGKRIAVPGRTTTAYLALQLYEKDFEPVFTPFDQIFSVLEKGEADLGLLIHEGQLTYQELGFEKIVDLGEWWFEEFRLPLPLGVNAIRKDLAEETKIRFTQLFLKSIECAMTHREEAMRYALEFGRGIDGKRGDRFVEMYVNDFSLELGERGLQGLQRLFDLAWENKIFPAPVRFETNLFFLQKGS